MLLESCGLGKWFALGNHFFGKPSSKQTTHLAGGWGMVSERVWTPQPTQVVPMTELLQRTQKVGESDPEIGHDSCRITLSLAGLTERGRPKLSMEIVLPLNIWSFTGILITAPGGFQEAFAGSSAALPTAAAKWWQHLDFREAKRRLFLTGSGSESEWFLAPQEADFSGVLRVKSKKDKTYITRNYDSTPGAVSAEVLPWTSYS